MEAIRKADLEKNAATRIQLKRPIKKLTLQNFTTSKKRVLKLRRMF